jgi:hypothetical protein
MAQTFAGWFAVSVGILLFITSNLALGYFISTVVRSQLQVMQISMFYMMPSLFLSGFMCAPLCASRGGSPGPFCGSIECLERAGIKIYGALTHRRLFPAAAVTTWRSWLKFTGPGGVPRCDATRNRCQWGHGPSVRGTGVCERSQFIFERRRHRVHDN